MEREKKKKSAANETEGSILSQKSLSYENYVPIFFRPLPNVPRAEWVSIWYILLHAHIYITFIYISIYTSNL